MAALLDLLLPPACPGCGREGEVLCAACRRPLARRLEEPPGVPLGLVAPPPEGIVQLEWLAPFTGTTRAVLHALKYAGARGVAVPLGEALAERWRRAGRGGDLLVPVPIHAARLRDRGYDQAELLAHAAGRALGMPVLPALRRAQETAAQHALGRGERRRNVGGAFRLDPRHAPALDGRWVVLVDDIVTTGSTLSGCAAALLDAGARAVSAVTVSREG